MANPLEQSCKAHGAPGSDREQFVRSLVQKAEDLRRVDKGSYNVFVLALLEVVGRLEVVEVVENLRGVLVALDALLMIDLDSTQLDLISNHLRPCLNSNDMVTIEMAIRTFGHWLQCSPSRKIVLDLKSLARVWIGETDPGNSRRVQGLLLMEKIALHEPVIFTGNFQSFFETIWTSIVDSSPVVRRAAVIAFKEALRALSGRVDSQLPALYDKLLKQLSQNLEQHRNEVVVIGTLNVFETTLLRSQQFVNAPYDKMLKLLWALREHNNLAVRNLVLRNIVVFAKYDINEFSTKTLPQVVTFALDNISKDTRDAAFEMLGELVTVKHFSDYTERVTYMVKEHILTKRNRDDKNPPIKSVECLAKIHANSQQPFITEANIMNCIDMILSWGLTETTIGAVHTMIDAPQSSQKFRATLIEKLLDTVSITLTGLPYKVANAPKIAQDPGEVTRDQRLLAFQVLVSFDFSGHDLSSMVEQCLSQYLICDEELPVRLAAVEAVTCLYWKSPPKKKSKLTRVPLQRRKIGGSLQIRKSSLRNVYLAMSLGSSSQAACDIGVVDRLLAIAVGDPNGVVRAKVLECFDARFDIVLSQPKFLHFLFMLCSDERLDIQILALTLVSRLARLNRTSILPALRKVIVTLLTDIAGSYNYALVEQQLMRLGTLVRGAVEMGVTFVSNIGRVIKTRWDLAGGSTSMAMALLHCIEGIAISAGPHFAEHDYNHFFIPRLLDMYSQHSQTRSAAQLRLHVLQCLLALIQRTSEISNLFKRYPKLHPLLTSAIKTPDELLDSKLEVVKILGALGAVDPLQMKAVHHHLIERGESAGTYQPFPDVRTHKECVQYVLQQFAAAMSGTSVAPVHIKAVESTIFIMDQCPDSLEFLHLVIPPIVTALMEESRLQLKPDQVKYYYLNLAKIVHVSNERAIDHIESLLQLVCTKWSQVKDVRLVMNLTIACTTIPGVNFSEMYIRLAPEFAVALGTQTTENVQLSTLAVILSSATYLQPFAHNVVPALLRLLSNDSTSTMVRGGTLTVLRGIGQFVSLNDHANDIVLSLMRLLRSVDSNGQPIANAIFVRDVFSILMLLMYQLQQGFAIFVPAIHHTMKAHHYTNSHYERAVAKLLKGVNPKLSDIHLTSQQEAQMRSCSRVNFSDDRETQANCIDSRSAPPVPGPSPKEQTVNFDPVLTAAQQKDITSRDDWNRWFDVFAQELVRQAPLLVLRSCDTITSRHPSLARSLFKVAFFHVWKALPMRHREFLSDVIQQVLESQSASSAPDIQIQLLSLAEFLEAMGNPLLIGADRLGRMALKTHANAKALRWKEIFYETTGDASVVDDLITLHSRAKYPESAEGLLLMHGSAERQELLKASYVKLGHWDKALETCQAEEANILELAREGKLAEEGKRERLQKVSVQSVQCYSQLGDYPAILNVWAKLKAAYGDTLPTISQFSNEDDDNALTSTAGHVAEAAWKLGDWNTMAEALNVLPNDTEASLFLESFLLIKNGEYNAASATIRAGRVALTDSMVGKFGESYGRGYSCLVTAQEFLELEEIIEVMQLPESDRPARLKTIKETWNQRLHLMSPDVHCWSNIITTRSLLLAPEDDVANRLKFIGLCHQHEMLHMEGAELEVLSGMSQSSFSIDEFIEMVDRNYNPNIIFACMQRMLSSPDCSSEEHRMVCHKFIRHLQNRFPGEYTTTVAQCYVLAGAHAETAERSAEQYLQAAKVDPTWSQAWHLWAKSNHAMLKDVANPRNDFPEQLCVNAVTGYAKSIELSPTTNSVLEDILQLYSIWFAYGDKPAVAAGLEAAASSIPIGVWLNIIPQLIARVDTTNPLKLALLKRVLVSVGSEHPQALIYPLTVALTSEEEQRKRTASVIMQELQTVNPVLVQQASLVSEELIRVAILWNEQWHQTLDDASRAYFTDREPDSMVQIIEDMYKTMDRQPQSMHEVSFVHSFGTVLANAQQFVTRYKMTRANVHLVQAWQIYFTMFKEIEAQLGRSTQLGLHLCSPKLFDARALELAVPGNNKKEKIHSFSETLVVMASKQRPRRFSVVGSEGGLYKFLLKGHEDLRLDERVMQLFKLVNFLLTHNTYTGKALAFQITRYTVTPLSANAGLIGWVDGCDTVQTIIQNNREERNIETTIELDHYCHLLPRSDHYTSLQLISKMEVFEYVLDHTTAQDIRHTFWRQSGGAERFLERRTAFTRSLAVMSMVGYVLGLGDRHTNNLMIQRATGKVVHIDFGDCFEVAINRDMFPEKVPFRLTRMLRNNMEVSETEGHFKYTAEAVMKMLRAHNHTVLALLGAFVHDPLISWRLTKSGPKQPQTTAEDYIPTNTSVSTTGSESIPLSLATHEPTQPKSVSKKLRMRDAIKTVINESKLAQSVDEIGSNRQGVSVLQRIRAKLAGRDFPQRIKEKDSTSPVLSRRPSSTQFNTSITNHSLSGSFGSYPGCTNNALTVPEQVTRLIEEATSIENLCQHFVGWHAEW